MKINIEGINKEITIVKKNRKTISIKITDKGEIMVGSPLYLSDDKIRQVIEDKKNWIVSKLKLIKPVEENEYENSGNMNFLGNICKINIHDISDNRIRLVFNNNEFHIYVPKDIKRGRNNLIKEVLIKWYKLQARKIFEERTEFYAEKLQVHPNKLFIKDQKTRWGSCSSKGNINYNYRIIMASMEVIDYLVVHELCHLVHPNHSKSFWNLVESIIPDHRNIRNWLKFNGNMLKI